MSENWYSLSQNEFKNFLESSAYHIPFADDTSILGKELKLCDHRIPNRIAIQPMEGCDCTADGTPTDLTIRRYIRFAGGGAGLIWVEANAVCPDGRANPRQMMLTADNLDAFKRMVDITRETARRERGHEVFLVLQETHSGRYSKPEGKSAPLIAYHCETLAHQEQNARILSDEALSRLPEQYARTTRLARQAGFDAVDVKACHRYLLSELFSAYTREGRYGGAYENRVRLMKDCARACAAELDGMILASRYNIYDGYAWPDGWGVAEHGDTAPDMSEPIRLTRELYEIGVRLSDLTLGNPYFNPHVNRPYDRGGYVPPESPFIGVERACTLIGQIKRAVPEMSVIASALSYLRVYAANAGAGMIHAGMADMAGYGRMAFSYPDFPADVLAGKQPDKAKVCITCGKCTELMRASGTPGCVVHDGLYTELYKEMRKA